MGQFRSGSQMGTSSSTGIVGMYDSKKNVPSLPLRRNPSLLKLAVLDIFFVSYSNLTSPIRQNAAGKSTPMDTIQDDGKKYSRLREWDKLWSNLPHW